MKVELERQDWQAAKDSAIKGIKEGKQLQISCEVLLERALKELKKFPEPKPLKYDKQKDGQKGQSPVIGIG